MIIMTIDRHDVNGGRLLGGPLPDHPSSHGAVYRLQVLGLDACLNPEGCIAVAYALLDAARWALPGGVEGCDDRHVREACEALYDRAVMVEGVESGYDDEVMT